MMPASVSVKNTIIIYFAINKFLLFHYLFIVIQRHNQAVVIDEIKQNSICLENHYKLIQWQKEKLFCISDIYLQPEILQTSVRVRVK